MKQYLDQTHNLDADGSPTGGATLGRGIDIRWQDGPLWRPSIDQVIEDVLSTDRDPNGAIVEDVLRVAIARLQLYQKFRAVDGNPGKLVCRENAIAITKLEEALMWLEKRAADRGVRVP